MTTAKWNIDQGHSEVNFKVKHLMISTVTGNFKVFEGVAETATEEFKEIRNISFKADVSSINTNNEQRDAHLRSEDFFASEEHPFIEFNAENFDTSKDKIQGELSIRGTRRTVDFDVDFGGVVVDGYGQTKAGLTISGKINRKEFGLTWDNVTEAGNVVVSDQVRISAEVQFTKQ